MKTLPSAFLTCLAMLTTTLGVLLIPSSAPALDPPPASLLSTDTDGDSQPDVAEWFTGTNPNLRTDAVKVDSVRRLTGPDRLELSWPAINGRSYNIEKSATGSAWQFVAAVSATAARVTTTVAVNPAAGNRLFYRVTTAYDTGRAPFITSFTADRSSPLTTAAFVRFKLKAYHPSGIAAVQILDGTTVIGDSLQSGQSEWVFDWYADERNNGAHTFKARMISNPGVSLDSSTLNFTVNVSGSRARRTVCDNLELSANSILQAGATVTATGNVRIGPFTVSGTAAVTWNTTTQIITGTGPLLGPGGVLITSSPWTFDAARCLLSLTGSIPPPVSLIPGFLTLTPSSLGSSSVVLGALNLTGSGTLTGTFTGRSPINAISASGMWFSSSNISATLQFTCLQAASFGSGLTSEIGSIIILQGVNLYGGPQPLASLVPMIVNGRLHFPAGTGGPAVVIDGFMEAKLPALDPSLPPLVQGTYVSSGLPVIGSVDPDGSFRPAALPPQPEYLLQYLENFVPLGPDCFPIEGGRVIADALGNLPPCEWRPVISCAGGRQTFSLRFPGGVKLVKSGATSLMQFLHMKLATAPDCPLQLAENYEIHASSTLTLDMDDSVTIQDLLGVLNINASLGIHVRIFGHFDATLKAGRFTPKGLVGAVLDFVDDATTSILDLLPDPGDSFVDFVLDFQCLEWIEIPCRWPASLPSPPGGPGGGYVFETGGPCECRVRLLVNGGICVYGSAKIRIGTGGPSFHAEINACDDKICMEYLAEDLDLSFSASWALPAAETIDIATGATKAILDPIAKALLPKICSFERRAVALLRWLDANVPTDPGPRLNYADMLRRQGKAMLESFANAKIAVPSLLTPAEIQAYIRQLGREARTSATMDALFEVWMALERLKAAGIPTAGDLQNARAEAWDEINDRLDARVAISVNSARRELQFYRERVGLLAQAGQAEDDAGVATRTGRVIDQAASLAAADLRVLAGVLDITQNPIVRSLPLEEAWSQLESWHALFADAAAQGIAVSAAALKPELLTQLGRQTEFLLAQLLSNGAAMLNRDYQAYLTLLSRYLQLLNQIAAGELPSQVVTTLPAGASMSSLESAVNAMARGGAGAMAAALYISMLTADSQQSGVIREIIRNAPAGTPLPSLALQQFYERIRARIDAGWSNLPSLTAAQLRIVLEAGTENARLRDILGLGDGSIGWESAQRLSAVIDRLVILSNSQTDVTILDTCKLAAMLLMDESWRFDRLPVPNQTKRKFCLLEAEKLGFRLLALANTLLSRATAPVTLTWAGGVKIEQAAAGFCYDIATHTFSGWGSGMLSLPGFNSVFTLKRLQFSTDGTATIETDAANLPGFPGTTFSMTGSISPGGVWSLSGTTTGTHPNPAALPWTITIQAGATITASNSGVSVSVNSITGGVSAFGTLFITTGGAASFTGTIAMDPITAGVMSLTGTGRDGAITMAVSGGATATVSGVIFTAGAPFNKSVGIAPFQIGPNYSFPPLSVSMPAITAGPFTFGVAWNWSVQVTAAPSMTITAGGTAVAAMSGVTSVSIPLAGGTISTNGSFSLIGTLASALAKPANLAWDIPLPAGTSYTLTPNNAAFTVSAAGSSLLQATGTTTAAWSGSPLTAAVTFNGTLSMDPSVLTDGIYSIVPAGAGVSRFSLTVNGGATATLTDSKLILAGPFEGASIPLPDFTLYSNYTFTDITPGPVNLTLRGFPLTNFQITLQRNGGGISIPNASCSLSPPGLPAILLTGPVSNGGAVSFNLVNTSQDFFGFGVTGSFSFGAPPVSHQSIIDNFTGEEPEGWWTLDETDTLSSCPDSGAWGHHGVKSRTAMNNKPPALYPGIGHSYEFNGTGDYVTIPDDDYLEGGTQMTITAWVRVSSFTRDWQTIVSKGDSAWRLSRYGNTNQVSFDTTSGGGSDSLYSSVSINDGRWHFVTGVMNGSSKYLYVDGRLENSRPYAVTIDSNAWPVMIGENAQATGRFWHGNIDEVIFLRRGLSPAEVRELHAAGNGLRFSFAGTASLPGINPSVSGSITSGGGFDFATSLNSSPTVLGFGFNSASFLFRRDENGAAAFTGSLQINPIPTQAGGFAPLSGNPVFGAVFVRAVCGNPPFDRPCTRATLTANDVTLNLCGYAAAGPGFDLTLSGEVGGILLSPAIQFSDFRFAGLPDLGDLGLPSLKGTIGTTGLVKVTHVNNVAIAGNTGTFTLGDLSLRNLHAPNAGITFNHTGLHIDGTFDLVISQSGFTRDLGDATFTGRIDPNGTFDLAGSCTLTFGAFSTDPFNARFHSSNYAGYSVIPDNVTPNLNFGNLDLPVNSFGLHQNGLGYTMTKSGDKVATHLSDHLKTTFHYDISWGYDFSSDALNAGMTGNAWWKWEIQNFAPPPGFASSGTFTISGGVNSGGGFTVDNNAASGSYFVAPYWLNNFFNFAPPPAWLWGSQSSVGYSLW